MRHFLFCLLVASPLAAQQPLSLADAVHAGMKSSVDVLVAETAVRQSAARRVQARSAILPSVGGTGSWVNRTFNIHTFGLEFPTVPGQPGFPDLVGPFSVLDARAQVTEALVDLSAWQRIRAGSAGMAVSEAARNVASQRAAAMAGEAYLRVARAHAMVEARTADSALADELARVAQAQLDAGVS